jgi:hypothetical protein
LPSDEPGQCTIDRAQFLRLLDGEDEETVFAPPEKPAAPEAPAAPERKRRDARSGGLLPLPHVEPDPGSA